MATRNKPKKLAADGLWDYALRALGSRAHSLEELRQKLSRRADSPGSLSETMKKLGDYGLTDDRKFSEALASIRLQNQGVGRLRVLRELRAKRVATPIAEAAIHKAYTGTDEAALIRAYIARKFRGKDLAEWLREPKNVASVYRRLRTAGFGSGASLSALKQYSSQVDEWNAPEEEEPL